ncbi:glycosyltransferase [Dyadobacter sp. CY261]|uniref:glycosyltransferase family 4 protein n=1 Tax=Dyadobacter sp. CY261 TaxID=2907203 RepID=UPI001F25D5A9|nr:glycosyltransferase [Dyadobacter sp. CY261]MCF0074493.1 glycosyltransferase [Dyadobacter sp. CY261]
MKILWFCNTPSLYKNIQHGYNGGGWMSSLERAMSSVPDLELGICFLLAGSEEFKVKEGSTTYYPVSLYNSKYKRIKRAFFSATSDETETGRYLEVINDFEPDIIHIFGSEQAFGLVQGRTQIPVVIHIQGILIPYLNAMFAPGTNALDYFRHLGLRSGITRLKDLSVFAHNARREEKILRLCRYFMGRTEWDNTVARYYAPHSQYFYCSEMLRSIFYEAAPWSKPSNSILQLATTISGTDYKGFDLILKTARLLQGIEGLRFEWKVFGIMDFPFWERKLKTRPDEVGLQLMGVASPEALVAHLQKSDMFIHPSYIDNSPNSVCEAQYLGVPVISTNVGGISSLITDGESGLLVPANDPFALVGKIMKIAGDHDLAIRIGERARTVAIARHDPDRIVAQNLAAYNSIFEANRK